MSVATLFDLTGQVALVTGASGGLGVRFAQVLAEAGASVALLASDAGRFITGATIVVDGGQVVAMRG